MTVFQQINMKVKKMNKLLPENSYRFEWNPIHLKIFYHTFEHLIELYNKMVSNEFGHPWNIAKSQGKKILNKHIKIIDVYINVLETEKYNKKSLFSKIISTNKIGRAKDLKLYFEESLERIIPVPIFKPNYYQEEQNKRANAIKTKIETLKQQLKELREEQPPTQKYPKNSVGEILKRYDLL